MRIPGQMCQSQSEHVWSAWSIEWETIGPEITIPVLVRHCSLCPGIEYANREEVRVG